MSGRSALCREQNTTMPSASRQQPRPEARHNVTSDYPRYDLHFAAASGNLGLVEYALRSGQPINSVLNGVLPLHAACAGGSEVVVKFLIDQGADVNAPRLPRRLSNEKHRPAGLSVGASGSTPLHFAAANGHMAVVNLLLACGAAPDKPDKHGVTPEMLARENGWIDCAEALAAWAGGRKGDLPPVQSGESSATDAGTSSTCFFDRGNGASASDAPDDSSSVNGSKRLHVKRSIDNALHMFKAPLTLHHHVSHSQLRDRAPPSPTSTAHHHHQSFLSSHMHHSHSQSGSPSHHSHLASLFHHTHSHSTTQLPTGKSVATISLNSGGSAISQHSTSPSRSQTLGDQTTAGEDSAELSVDALYQQRRPSLPQMFDNQTGPFKRRTSSRRRRPRSAGSDAQANVANRSVSSPVGQIGTGSGNGSSNSIASAGNGQIPSSAPSAATRKLSSKLSLRNLFRRQTNDASATAGGSEPNSGPGSVSTSFSGSSAPIYGHVLAGSSAHAIARGSASPTPPASPLSSSFSPSPAPVHIQGTWYRQKMGSEGGNAANTRSPLVPSAVELHHQYSDDNLREFYDEPETTAQPPVAPPLSSRPSILRGHNRSNSSSSTGGASTPGSGPRTLRFDASPSGSSAPSLKAIVLRGCRSASSLRHGHTYELDEGDEDEDDYGESLVPDSAPPNLTQYREDELEQPDTDSASNEAQTQMRQRREATRPMHLSRLAHGGQLGRARGESFASNGSSSPGATPDSGNTPYTSTDFPFSLDRPPLTPLSATSESTQHTLPDEGQEYVHVRIAGRDLPHALSQKRSVGGAESRGRGESFSSVETDESAASRPDARSQASSDVTSVTTPSPGVLPRKGSVLGSTVSVRKVSASDIDPYLTGSASELEGADDQSPMGKDKDRDDVACPLDARKVSDLAGAQDLVRRAQQAILVSASAPPDGPDSPGGTLSEQLAAYGEILALERRFARGEKQRTQWAQRHDSDEERDREVKSTPKSSRMPQSAKEARAALSERRRNTPSKQRGVTTGAVDGFGFSRKQHPGRPLKSRRPHTAEGATQHNWGTPSGQETPAMSRNAHGDDNATPKNSPPARSHVRSTSTPLHITVTQHDEDLPVLTISPGSSSGCKSGIQIIETTATPIDEPSLLNSSSSLELTPQLSSIRPATCPAQTTCPLGSPSEFSSRDLSSRYTIDDPRPHLPLRSRTPDPDNMYDASDCTGFSSGGADFGAPLTRVSTAPLQDSTSSSTFPSSSSGRWGGMKPMSAKKLVKMGIPLDAGSYSLSGGGSSGSSGVPSPESSRSPSKARFGGIKSLVKGLTSKS